MVMNNRRHKPRRERRERSGFSLLELTIVIVVAGLLLVPLIRMAGEAIISDRVQKTQSVLEIASKALISHAAVHGGCLPFAADPEGGYPDTDASGAASALPDTGEELDLVGAGDLPWSDLGLTNAFLDGDGLRIQYYVASPFSDEKEGCVAGFRGFPYSAGVTYITEDKEEIYVYDFDPDTGNRTLYEIEEAGKGEINILPAGTHPSDAVSTSIIEYSNPLPDELLQVRRGPDVTAAAPQSDVISSQNVFILIAPGNNRNPDIDRLFVRDSTHTKSNGAVWTLGINTVDDHIFSSEPNVGAADPSDDGDDTVFVMSFTRFKAEMGRHGLNMEPVCELPC